MTLRSWEACVNFVTVNLWEAPKRVSRGLTNEVKA